MPFMFTIQYTRDYCCYTRCKTLGRLAVSLKYEQTTVMLKPLKTWCLLMPVPPLSLENTQYRKKDVILYVVASVHECRGMMWHHYWSNSPLLYCIQLLLLTRLKKQIGFKQAATCNLSPLLGALNALAPSHGWGDHGSQSASFGDIHQTGCFSGSVYICTYSCFTPKGAHLSRLWFSVHAPSLS